MASISFVFFQVLPLSFLSWFAWRFLRSALKSYPGPFIARFTDLWRLYDVWVGHAEITQQKLHAEHGQYVRLGPNCLSISDPRAIQDIYTTRNAFPKSDFYSVGDIVHEGKVMPSQFSSTDEAWHTRTMRPINKLYSLNNVVNYEPLMDSTIKTLIKQLDERFVKSKKPCDMHNWLHYYAWDVVGEVTFSKQLGFLEKGEDVDGTIDAGKKAFDYMAVVGQIPFLDQFMDKNRIYQIGPPGFGSMGAFCAQQLFTRMGGGSTGTNDFMDRFIKTKETDPDVVDDERLISYLIINVAAGSDTTAIALRSAVYHVLRSPEVLQRLQKELDDANVEIPVSWSKSQSLPYLDAVIKESMRIHPSVGMPLERVLDERGLKLPNGRYLPPGVIVGMNPAVVHRDPEVFGANANDFVPERWLKASGEDASGYEARLAAMNQANLTFGHGSRGCLGRHLAILEVYKLISTLFKKYDMKLAHPEREWKTKNGFFNRQWDMDVLLAER